ncbi:peptidoglycan bridge formation glycyltransferase FemA/FemB family protein (plasmid) [Bacillus mycoides]|nr:peptidoglycan bridge formation glycyltransferase FemA/FemB family protein [Bacillus mycoides]
MITFVSNISKEKFNAFVSSHHKNHLFQSYEWGELKAKTGWDAHYVGLERDSTLVAAAVILLRPIPVVNKKVAYASRGFVIDFKNKQLMQLFTEELKKYLKEHDVFMLRLDPDILYRERDIDGNLVENGKHNMFIIEQMKELGYIHRGKELNYGGFQPRFTFRLDIQADINDVFQQFHRQTKYKIRYAQKRGIEIIEGRREDLSLFQKLSDITAERAQFTMRPISYFETMYDAFESSKQMKLYFTKCNLKTAKKYIEEELQKREEELLSIRKKIMQDDDPEKHEKWKMRIQQLEQGQHKLQDEKRLILELQCENPNGIILSGAIFIKHGYKAWYLYGGSNNILRNFMPNYLLQWHMIQEAKSLGCDTYDFFGMSGDTSASNPLYGIYKFKRGFHPQFTEFVGEFDLILLPFPYQFFTKALPFRRWCRLHLLQIKRKVQELVHFPQALPQKIMKRRIRD